MEQVLINESSLQDIANAIREKTEGTEPILPSEMGDVIRAIGSGLKFASGTTPITQLTMTNGTRYGAYVTGLDFKPIAVAVGYASTNPATGVANTNNFVIICNADGEIVYHCGYDLYPLNYRPFYEVGDGYFKIGCYSSSSWTSYSPGWIALGV